MDWVLWIFTKICHIFSQTIINFILFIFFIDIIVNTFITIFCVIFLINNFHHFSNILGCYYHSVWRNIWEKINQLVKIAWPFGWVARWGNCAIKYFQNVDKYHSIIFSCLLSIQPLSFHLYRLSSFPIFVKLFCY